jgi:hypothetical protein
MALTNRQIIELLTTNTGLSDAQLVRVMEVNGISPAQMASAVGVTEGQIAARVAASVPQGQTISLGDTIVQPVYETTGSGMDQQVGGIENVITYKATDNKAGGLYTQYTPTGEVEKTGTQQEVKSGLKEFAIGAALLFSLPTLLNAGAATTASAAGGATPTFAGEALTEAGLLSGGTPTLGNGAFLGEGVVSGIPASDAAFLNAGGTFNPAYGLPVGNGAFLGEGVPTGIPASDTAFLNAGGTFDPAFTLGADGLVGTPTVTTPTVTTPTVTTPTVTTPTVIPPGVIPALTSLITPALQTTGGLLQQQTSREAAQKAQAMIDAETTAAKQAAMFRPIGMTTRFGTSNFGFDPVTGQLTSAGYTLSPEAKAAQDRFVKLAESSLQQAEGAEALFAPLKTGAASLFSLGQGYLAKTPEQVASDYLKGQMSLLQPGREMELANLQNKLFQQGRSGVAVAQGGTYGDTTPELQALYNARARQEAELAAGAQRAGQQDVLFGAGLLGQGSTALGNYYAGQTAAYSPYKTALGEVQNLEQLAQQPLTMGIGLGEKSAQAGYNVGRLGLQGAGQSVALATGADATRNPAASAIGGLTSNPLFTNAIAKLAGGTPVNALDFGAYGTGDAGFQKMLEEVYG